MNNHPADQVRDKYGRPQEYASVSRGLNRAQRRARRREGKGLTKREKGAPIEDERRS